MGVEYSESTLLLSNYANFRFPLGMRARMLILLILIALMNLRMSKSFSILSELLFTSLFNLFQAAGRQKKVIKS